MTLTKKQREDFEGKTNVLIEWLNDNCHPHTQIQISTTHAELFEGVAVHHTTKFIKG